MMTESPVRKIQRADRSSRRKAVVLVLTAVVSGLILVMVVNALLRDIQDLGEDDPSRAMERLVGLLRIIVWGFILFLLFTSAWIVRLAYRIYRSGRFPPPGMSVIRDTVVREGKQARIIGGMIIGGVVFILIMSVASLWQISRLIDLISRNVGR